MKYGTDYIAEECHQLNEFGSEYSNATFCVNVTKTNWIEFNSLSELPHKNIKIGLFTDTKVGEKVEWIPNIQGFDILEWADYEIVGLATYHDRDWDYSVDYIFSISISSDGNYLATSSYTDAYVSIMNITDKTQIVPLATYYDSGGDYSIDQVSSISISPDGNYLVTSSYNDAYVSIMNITDKTQIVPLATYHDTSGDYSVDGVYSISISSDGNYLATSSLADDYVSIMNITDKTQIVPLATYHDNDGAYSVDEVYSISVSSDGNYLVTSSYYDDYVSIMNITDKTQIVPLATYQDIYGDYSVDGVRSISVSSDGNYLVTSSYNDDYVSIMDITDKTQIVPLATYHDSDGDYSVDEVRSISISSDGNYLATSSYYDAYVSIMQFNKPDSTAPTYSDNSTNSTLAGQDILHSLKWTDETGLSTTGGYIFSFDNGTGSFTNDTWVAFSSNSDWSNVTKSVNTTVGATIKWKIYANDTSDNWATSTTYSYITTTSDSCSNCDGTSDCYWDCSDDCTISDNINMNGYDIEIKQTTTGTHTITITGNITNWGDITTSGYDSSNKCNIICENCGGFK